MRKNPRHRSAYILSMKNIYSRKYVFLAVSCVLLWCGGTAFARPKETQDQCPPPAMDRHHMDVRFFSRTPLYPYYLADLRRPQAGIALLDTTHSQLPHGGGRRYYLFMGAKQPLLSFAGTSDGLPAVEIELMGGLYAQFNRMEQEDNIGWNGSYDAAVVFQPVTGLVMRVGYQHDSSHIGDEYLLKYGNRRINYMRDEIAAAACLRLSSSIMLYSEVGYMPVVNGYYRQRPFRLQGGGELSIPVWRTGGALQWIIAADLKFWEENRWGASWCVLPGIKIHIDRQRSRALMISGLFYSGRALLTEYYMYREIYSGLRLSVEL